MRSSTYRLNTLVEIMPDASNRSPTHLDQRHQPLIHGSPPRRPASATGFPVPSRTEPAAPRTPPRWRAASDGSSSRSTRSPPPWWWKWGSCIVRRAGERARAGNSHTCPARYQSVPRHRANKPAMAICLPLSWLPPWVTMTAFMEGMMRMNWLPQPLAAGISRFSPARGALKIHQR